jgi:Leucine-rich repeat (LRR) protein
METPGTSRVPKVRWFVLATVVIVVGGAGLRWWTGRSMVREIRRLGGSAAISSSSWIPDALEQVLMVDANVDQITFQGTTIPDEFFDRIGRLHSLFTLKLIHCNISDAAWIRLREVPSLRQIALDETDLTDTTVATLAELRKLWDLRLSGTKITDAALREISRLGELKYLELRHTAISDEGLVSLKGMSKLQILNLSDTSVTDAGLEELHGNSFHILVVQRTKVTADGVAKLQATMRGRVVGP